MTAAIKDKHECDTESCMISCIRKGDKQAFGKLYDRYAPALLGLISGITNDSALSEEILQAVFLRTLQTINTFDPEKMRFFTWMLQTARSLALEAEQNRKNKPDTEIPASENFVNSPTDRHYPLKKDLKNGHFKSGSGTDSAIALHLIYFKGYSYADAAGLLGITVTSLQTQIRTELKALSGISIK